MSDAFESPVFLVQQTFENLAEFQAIGDSLFGEGCSALVVEVDPETGNKTYKIKFMRPIPGRVRHIVTTAISDLRHALDQTACACVKLLTGAVPDFLYFPFASHPNDLAARLKQKFPPAIHATIERFQPYPTGEGYSGGNNLLSHLGKAASPNKHQISCRIGGSITEFWAESIRVSHGIGDVEFPPAWDVVNNEMVIATVAPHGDCQLGSIGIRFDILLDDAGPLTGYPALGVLTRLTAMVDNIIFSIREETTYRAEAVRLHALRPKTVLLASRHMKIGSEPQVHDSLPRGLLSVATYTKFETKFFVIAVATNVAPNLVRMWMGASTVRPNAISRKAL